MVSERFKQLREALGKSQTDFGAGLGVSRSVINNIERNVTEPSEVFLNHLCDVYKVNRNWLDTGDGDMFESINQTNDASRFIESVTESPAMRSLLATWAQLSDENKAVFKKFAADYIDDYYRRMAEDKTAEDEALVDNAVTASDSDMKQA